MLNRSYRLDCRLRARCRRRHRRDCPQQLEQRRHGLAQRHRPRRLRNRAPNVSAAPVGTRTPSLRRCARNRLIVCRRTCTSCSRTRSRRRTSRCAPDTRCARADRARADSAPRAPRHRADQFSPALGEPHTWTCDSDRRPRPRGQDLPDVGRPIPCRHHSPPESALVPVRRREIDSRAKNMRRASSTSSCGACLSTRQVPLVAGSVTVHPRTSQRRDQAQVRCPPQPFAQAGDEERGDACSVVRL
jgi:hypothetical protein